MKRREFLKVAAVGSLGALVGARVAKALEVLPTIDAPEDKLAVDSCTTDFSLWDEPRALQVYMNGVMQVPGEDYTLEPGGVLRFKAAAAESDLVVVQG